MSRASGLFLASIVAALFVGHALRDTPGYAVRQADGSLVGDIDHYVYWTRLVTLGGVQSAYGGTWPETYAVYPPLTLYAYQALGTAYRAVEDPAFEPDRAQASVWLREGIKFVALSWHLLTALGIYGLVRTTVGSTHAGVAGALYVLNPAALYDAAHWAQPDGAHSLFSVLAIGLLSLGHTVLPGIAIAVAALAKPQAWVLLPLMAIELWRQRRVEGVVRAGVAGGVVALVVIAPFLVSGRWPELLSLPGTIASVMPIVSADAHNFWWLVLEPRGIDSITTPDSARLIGPLTYRLAASLLVVAQLAMTYWLVWTRRTSLGEAAALGVLGWFVFTTQAHENHLFFALPLLALAWPARPSLLVVYVLLTLTLLLNMALHDQLVLESLGFGLGDPLVEQLRTLNAALNVITFFGWAVVATLRGAEARARRTLGIGTRIRPTVTIR